MGAYSVKRPAKKRATKAKPSTALVVHSPPIDDEMRIEMMPLTAIKAYTKNPRIIPDSAITKVANSIKTFGFRQAIVVNEQNTIIVGHTRLMAAAKLGMTHVPVHVARGLSKAQVKAYRLADNRVAQESSWDDDMAGEELYDLRLDDFDLLLTGFDQIEVDRLLHETAGIDFPDLPDGDKSPFEQITFTLHASQADIVREALDVAKHAGAFIDSPNENSNGNALTRIAEASLGVLR